MVVRPYPQVQTHGPSQAAPQTVSIQSGTPVTVPAPTVHHAQGQPAVLTEGQMKVIIVSRPLEALSIYMGMLKCEGFKMQLFALLKLTSCSPDKSYTGFILFWSDNRLF